MSKERVSMRKIKEVLRLIYENKISQSKTAKVCNVSRATVQEYIMRFNASGVQWPIGEEITDEILENRLYPPDKNNNGDDISVKINYEYLAIEIRRPNVTLALLWEEYKQTNPNGYNYSYFCNLFRQYTKTLNYSMRQEHKAGEKGFLDFGEGLRLKNTQTGELISTKLFVFVWGASNYTFAKATYGEDLSSWIKVNVEALEYFGCCPKVEVPDNLKAAVTKACRYEPDINPTYNDFAMHYGLTIMPARPGKPKDKPKVELGVKLAKRWILAKLRNKIFTNLEDMNQDIEELLEIFNNKIMKKFKKSRKELFENLDRPNANLLPEKRYEFAEWKKVRVNINYHINFGKHDYSVPYTLIHQELEVRATACVIEIYKKGNRITSHLRSYQEGKYTTVHEHMPPSHQKYLEWTPERILNWAGKLGPAVSELVDKIMNSRSYPEQAYKSCLGIIRLEKHFSREQIDRACRRAITYRNYSYKGVSIILEKGLDKEEIKITATKKIVHENIRGADYYADTLKENMQQEMQVLLQEIPISNSSFKDSH